MNIFRICADYDTFQYLLPKTEADYIKCLDREGEPFENWQIPTQICYKKTKKDQKKRSDFNASCFFSGILLMEEALATKMVADFGLSAQLLPINTPEKEEKFVFVNILGGVSAVLEAYMHQKVYVGFQKLSQEKTEYPPELEHKYLFDANILEINAIFRDKWLNSFYFCTDIFVKWAENNGVKGLRFENAGIIN